MSWDDGERLLSLSSEVLSGGSSPQAFTFLPRGSVSSADAISLFVRPDDPIELLTDYDNAEISVTTGIQDD